MDWQYLRHLSLDKQLEYLDSESDQRNKLVFLVRYDKRFLEPFLNQYKDWTIKALVASTENIFNKSVLEELDDRLLELFLDSANIKYPNKHVEAYGEECINKERIELFCRKDPRFIHYFKSYFKIDISLSRMSLLFEKDILSEILRRPDLWKDFLLSILQKYYLDLERRNISYKIVSEIILQKEIVQELRADIFRHFCHRFGEESDFVDRMKNTILALDEKKQIDIILDLLKNNKSIYEKINTSDNCFDAKLHRTILNHLIDDIKNIVYIIIYFSEKYDQISYYVKTLRNTILEFDEKKQVAIIYHLLVYNVNAYEKMNIADSCFDDKLQKAMLNHLIDDEDNAVDIFTYLCDKHSEESNFIATMRNIFLNLNDQKQTAFTYYWIKKHKDTYKKLNITSECFEETTQTYLIYLLIDNAVADRQKKRETFDKFVDNIYTRLENALNDFRDTKSMNNFESIVNLGNLFPKCNEDWGTSYRVIYLSRPFCEGKLWNIDGDPNKQSYYCARHRVSHRKRCDYAYEKFSSNDGTSESKLKQEGFLLDILFMAGYYNDAVLSARSLNQKNCLSKLSGAINRTYELAQRLHCRKCGEVLKFDLRFAKKKLAAYSVTVAKCPHGGEGHDNDVYFSHCINPQCTSIIDSRDSMKHPIDKYYICEECGAHRGGTWGDMCPKCLKKLDKNGKCISCGHQIDINGHSRNSRCLLPRGFSYREPYNGLIDLYQNDDFPF